MDKAKYLEELNKIISEAEQENTASSSTGNSKKQQSSVTIDTTSVENTEVVAESDNTIPVQYPPTGSKNYHIGRRARVKKSVASDPDFNTFSDHEVLEYLLYATLPRVDTNQIAHVLIDTFGSFSGVLNATINELVLVPHVTEQTARMLTSIVPASRKSEMSRLRNNVIISNTVEAVNYMHPFYVNRSTEFVYMLCLNSNDRVIGVDLISSGDTNFTSFDIKKIIETACRHKATKIVISHNHPAGSLEPSQADKDVTSRLAVALLSMGIILLDHLIFTSKNYYSFFLNRDFESIYERIDSMFKTDLLNEVRLKKKNYVAGRYIFEPTTNNFNEQEKEPKHSNDESKAEYMTGHPSLASFSSKK